MAKFAIAAIVLLASTGALSQEIVKQSSESEGGIAAQDANMAIVRDILQKVMSGESDRKDDEKLIEIIKQEIVRTAEEIKTPAGSIDAAARKAQILVSELTAAYTSAIYKSKSGEEGRENFARFQSIVQAIVEFVKNGHFLT